MARYVSLLQWTDQGVKNVKDTVNRLHEARTRLQGIGVTIVDAAWAQGRYDVVLTVEAPDDATLATALLGAASQGFFRTETMRVFTESEMEQIIGKLP